MARAILPTRQAHSGLQLKGALTLALPQNWKYREEGHRDLRLDFLRGFCLFVIIANHIGFYPAFTIYLTGGGFFLTSAAEGFIFISGLVLGLVYGPRIIKEGLSASTGKILHRAGQLYLWNMLVSLAYLTIAHLTPLQLRREQVVAPPELSFDLVVRMATLKQTFGWSDLLATYAVLVAVAPIILYFLTQKKGWWVSGISVALWLGYQISPENFSPTLGTFPVLAWQVLFVHGLVIGFHREAIKEFFSKWPAQSRYLPLAMAFVGLLALGINWLYAGTFDENVDLSWFLTEMFDKNALRPGRVITFLVFFQVFYLLLTRLWEPINSAFGWLFNLLGQNSLYVYILHGFVVSMFFNIPNYGDASALIHTAGHIAAVLMLWSLVRSKFMFKLIPR